MASILTSQKRLWTPDRRFSLPSTLMARAAGVRLVPEDAPLHVPGLDLMPHDLDAPFLWLNDTDFISFRQAYEHWGGFSESGGGKSTGPGQHVLSHYVFHGFSGLSLSYKSDDASRIIEIAQKYGREDDLIIVSPHHPWTCNVLDWEFSRTGEGAGNAESVTAMLWEVLENVTPSGRRDGESFFTTGARRLGKFGMEGMIAAGERVTMPGLKAIIDGIPTRNTHGQLVWADDSYLRECLWKAEQRGTVNPAVHNYFLKEFTRPGGERQSAGVISTFTHAADFFLDSAISRLFFEETTFTPEDALLKGKIVVLALPVTEYGALGRAAQILFKACFINQALRRQGLPPGHTPAFLYIDEYQQFATELDTRLTEAGRSSCVSMFVMTQNLPNLYKAMEASRAHDVVEALVGNYGTLIFGRQKCRVTNEFAQQTIQRAMTVRWSGGDSVGGGKSRTVGFSSGSNSSAGSGAGGGHSSSGSSYSENVSRTVSGNWSENHGWRQEMDWSCPAEIFLNLRGGGPPDYMVDTVLVKAGARFAANQGRPWLYVSWPQNAQAVERWRAIHAPRRRWGRRKR